MRPTIGRIVFYFTGNKKTLPAIVVSVFDDATVNLQVFDDGKDGCYYVNHVSQGFDTTNWNWPPKV